MRHHTCLEHPKFVCPGCEDEEATKAALNLYVDKLEAFIKTIGRAPRQSIMKQAKTLLAERPKS